MPTIKLTDEEATAFFTEQIGKKHSCTIQAIDLLKEQVYTTALYFKQQKTKKSYPLVVLIKIEFPYFNARLDLHLNTHCYLQAIVDYHYDRQIKEIVASYYTNAFYFRYCDFFESNTGKEYKVVCKNSFEKTVYCNDLISTRTVNDLASFLRYKLPDINQNLLCFMENEFSSQRYLNIDLPTNQRLKAL